MLKWLDKVLDPMKDARELYYKEMHSAHIKNKHLIIARNRKKVVDNRMKKQYSCPTIRNEQGIGITASASLAPASNTQLTKRVVSFGARYEA